MIKGEQISNLMMIEDTSPGSIPVWFVIIICLGMHVMYSSCMILWYKQKIAKLNEFTSILKKGQQDIIEPTKKTQSIKTETVQKIEKKKSFEEERTQFGGEDLTHFEKELAVFQNLKRKRW